ncbi:MAG: hypothetical protein P9L99_09425 [Candidatus Lernaella stagnicola]|nr:hypothetical protein [Candidatus Lernaella stagnicola]
MNRRKWIILILVAVVGMAAVTFGPALYAWWPYLKTPPLDKTARHRIAKQWEKAAWEMQERSPQDREALFAYAKDVADFLERAPQWKPDSEFDSAADLAAAMAGTREERRKWNAEFDRRFPGPLTLQQDFNLAADFLPFSKMRRWPNWQAAEIIAGENPLEALARMRRFINSLYASGYSLNVVMGCVYERVIYESLVASWPRLSAEQRKQALAAVEDWEEAKLRLVTGLERDAFADFQAFHQGVSFDSVNPNASESSMLSRLYVWTGQQKREIAWFVYLSHAINEGVRQWIATGDRPDLDAATKLTAKHSFLVAVGVDPAQQFLLYEKLLGTLRLRAEVPAALRAGVTDPLQWQWDEAGKKIVYRLERRGSDLRLTRVGE